MTNVISLLYKNFFIKRAKVLFPAFIGEKVECEGHNFIGRFSHIKNTVIGKYTYIGNNCEFSNVKIGGFCSISSYVKVLIGTHPSKKWISTHPLFFSRNSYVGKGFCDDDRYPEIKTTPNGYSCEIGNDVWIGANVCILQGIKIGNGAIIGANSLVTKDVSPYTIVGGVPAKVIRKRFSDEDIIFLERIEWWKWPNWRIKELAKYFDNIGQLKKHL